MNVYIYTADIYCETCGERIRQERALPDGATADDEGSFDSDEWPKGPYPHSGGVADMPQHCAGCGVFLQNPLTAYGYSYVAEALDRYKAGLGGDKTTLRTWHDFYVYDDVPELAEARRP